MSLETDSAAAFDGIAAVDRGSISLDRSPAVSCLLPNGISRTAELGRGSIRSETVIKVIVRKNDVGSAPQAGTPASLTYHGKSYRLAVSEEDVEEIGGALYVFTLAN